MKQKRVYLMCGLPGSGKSTWIKERIAKEGGVHISRDEIRFSMLNEQDEYFQKEDSVFAEFCHQAQLAISDDSIENVYIDATHLSGGSRRKIMNQLNMRGVRRICVAFEIPLKVCLERNAKRAGRALVPAEVIENMSKNYFIPSPGGMFQEVWNVNENGKVVVYT